MRTLDQIVDALPADRRAAVEARGRELIAEEMALRQLRQAHNLTQQNMATLLEIDQAGVSKIEKRSDMLISTMRSFVEAMGGRLRVVAEFPDGVVEVRTFGEVADGGPEPVKPKRAARRPELVRAD